MRKSPFDLTALRDDLTFEELVSRRSSLQGEEALVMLRAEAAFRRFGIVDDYSPFNESLLFWLKKHPWITPRFAQNVPSRYMVFPADQRAYSRGYAFGRKEGDRIKSGDVIYDLVTPDKLDDMVEEVFTELLEYVTVDAGAPSDTGPEHRDYTEDMDVLFALAEESGIPNLTEDEIYSRLVDIYDQGVKQALKDALSELMLGGENDKILGQLDLQKVTYDEFKKDVAEAAKEALTHGVEEITNWLGEAALTVGPYSGEAPINVHTLSAKFADALKKDSGITDLRVSWYYVALRDALMLNVAILPVDVPALAGLLPGGDQDRILGQIPPRIETVPQLWDLVKYLSGLIYDKGAVYATDYMHTSNFSNFVTGNARGWRTNEELEDAVIDWVDASVEYLTMYKGLGDYVNRLAEEDTRYTFSVLTINWEEDFYPEEVRSLRVAVKDRLADAFLEGFTDAVLLEAKLLTDTSDDYRILGGKKKEKQNAG